LSVVIRGSSFLGEAIIPLENLEKDVPMGAWYRLGPRKKDLEGLTADTGSIRMSLKVLYSYVEGILVLNLIS